MIPSDFMAFADLARDFYPIISANCQSKVQYLSTDWPNPSPINFEFTLEWFEVTATFVQETKC